MKRCLILTALAGLLVAGATAPGAAALYQVEVGGISSFTTQPVTVNGAVLVPLRETLAQLGVTDVAFLPATNRVTFNARGQGVVIDLTAAAATVGGQPVALAGPVRSLSGQVWVPATFISQLFPDYSITQVRGFRFAPAMTPEVPTPVPQPYGPSSIRLNGQSIAFSSPTWYMGGVLMVPLNETLQGLGIEAPQYSPGDLQVSFVYQNSIVRMNVMSGYVQIGDQAFPIDRPAVARGGDLYVPATLFPRLVPGTSITVPQG